MKSAFQRVALTILFVVLLSSCSPSSPAPAAGAQVVLDSLTNRPGVLHVGDKVVFEFALRNTGTNAAPSRSYLFDLYVDGRDVAFDHATADLLPDSVTPYGMEPGHFHWQPTNAGAHHFEFVLIQGERTNTTKGVLDVLP
jgi:hypothetical protein